MEKKYTLNIIINNIRIPFASGSLKELDLITTGFDDKEDLWNIVKKRYIQKSFLNKIHDGVEADFCITYIVNKELSTIDVLYADDYKFLSMKPNDLKRNFLLCSNDPEYMQDFISEYVNHATPNSTAKKLIDDILKRISYGADYREPLNEYLNILLHGYSSIEDANYKGCRDIYLADKKYREKYSLLEEGKNDFMSRAFNEKHIEFRKELLDKLIILNYESLTLPPLFKILTTGENINSHAVGPEVGEKKK